MPWPPDAPHTPHDPLFDSSWLKWGRACVHAQALQADLDALGTDGSLQPTFAVRAEYQPKRHGFAVIVTDIDPMPSTWGLLVGDIANNLRSALDQIAWAIVTRGKTPPGGLSEGRRKNIYFPLCQQRHEFAGAAKSRLPGVRRADLARVRLYQPYQHSGWSYALPRLAKINADDKHRTIQPIWAVSLASTLEVTDQRDCVIHERETTGRAKALKVGTELGLVRARKMGPQPHIEVVPHLSSEPAFEDGLPIRGWLRIAIWWVQWLLYEFSEMPPEIERLGLDIDNLRRIMAWKPPW